MRRSLATVAFSAVIAAAAADTATAQDMTLRVTATPSTFADMFRTLVDRFEAANPDIAVELDASQRDQNDLVQQLFRQAITGDLPDVSFQGYNYLRNLVDRDLVVPLDNRVAGDPEWTEDTYSSSVTETGTIGETVYGLGVGISFPIIYYNKALVAEALGDEPFPQTWDGIFELTGLVQERNADVLGIFSRSNAFVFQGYLGSFGGTMMNADETEITFTDEAGRQTFDLLHRFGEAGQSRVDMTRSQARQAFIAGSLAAIVDSSSTLSSYEEQTGDTFDVGTAPLPLGTEDARLPAAGIAVVMLADEAERQEAAWRFMRFVTGPEGQGVVGRMTGYIPANRVAVEREDILGDYYAARPNVNAALSSLPFAQNWYAFPGENSVRITSMIQDRLGEVLTLRQEPQAALEQLASDIRPLLP